LIFKYNFTNLLNIKSFSLLFICVAIHNINAFAQIPEESLKLWLKADNVDVIDNRVYKWYDLSSSQYELVQDAVSSRPEFLIDPVLSEYPVLKFDGTNDFFQIVFTEPFSSPISIFIVWRTYRYGQQVALDNLTSLILDINAGNNVRIATGEGTIQYSKTSPFDFIVTSAVYNNEHSLIFENGILKVTGNTRNLVLPGLNIGKWSMQNSRWLSGAIAEIIVYDSNLNIDDQQSVEAYLMNKYAPPISLGEDIVVENSFCDTLIKNIDKSWFTSYLWSTGETDSVIHVNQSGTYSLTVTDIFGRESSD
jgi:hypothetical protein